MVAEADDDPKVASRVREVFATLDCCLGTNDLVIVIICNLSPVHLIWKVHFAHCLADAKLHTIYADLHEGAYLDVQHLPT